MKKLLLSILMVIALASIVSAGNVGVNRVVNYAECFSDGAEVMTAISIENELGFNAKDAKVTVSIPDLGVYRRSHIREFENHDVVSKMLVNLVEGEITPGYYTVRIAVSGDHFARYTHREIFLC